MIQLGEEQEMNYFLIASVSAMRGVREDARDTHRGGRRRERRFGRSLAPKELQRRHGRLLTRRSVSLENGAHPMTSWPANCSDRRLRFSGRNGVLAGHPLLRARAQWYATMIHSLFLKSCFSFSLSSFSLPLHF
jgi:hypothetical protein